jgi:glycosyltransferase involved in cell wall biosynthesis
MNVLVVSTLVPNARGTSAGAIVMHGEARAIAQRHDVTIATLATPADSDGLRLLRDEGFRVHAVMRRRADGAFGFVRRVSIGFTSQLHDLPLRTAIFREGGMQRMLDRLSNATFDVVHVLDNAMASYRLPAGRARLLSEYEVQDEADEREKWRRYQAGVWTKFDRVQVFTDADAAAACRLVPEVADRLRVNPFGVHVSDMRDPTSERPNSMLFVGGFRHPPNVDAALWLADEIMPLVLRQHPTARLTIVGADVPDAVRRRAGDAIDVVGRVDDVEPFVASSSLVVAPLRAGGGMRLKVLQAMAAARPVVTTTRGAAGIWNPAGAPTLLIADDAAGIATHVASLLASESARQALGARAREAAINHHRWDQFAERLHAIYDEVLASGAAA